MLVACCLVGLCLGAVLIGLTSYVPTYVQGVLGTGPLVAGFALAMLTIGWPVTASQSGRVYLRVGFRATAAAGSAVVVAGTAAVLLVTLRPAVVAVGAACFAVGAGLGFVAAPTLIAAQATVGWAQRGVVTAANMFSRSIGSAVGVALFGAVANATLRSTGATVPGLTHAARHVFGAVVVFAVAMGAAVLLMPRTPAADDRPVPVPATAGEGL
jgi:MFS family permease